jgi:hypothetical protein
MGDVDINRGIDRVHDSQVDMETVCDDRRCATLSMNEIARNMDNDSQCRQLLHYSRLTLSDAENQILTSLVSTVIL